ncbi:MAG TPA: hypothetical protein VFI41_04655 [Gemmatimonadales bacterium]|nr:hypothetical protein [Gemmatimonadales bacterium]
MTSTRRPAAPTAYMTGATNAAVQAVAFERNIGLLLTPDTAGLTKKGDRVGGYANKIDLHPFIGLDNGGFGAKGRDFIPGWWAWLNKLVEQMTAGQLAKVRFAAAPDKLDWVTPEGGKPFCIGDATATLDLFRVWAPRIKALGLPVALVAQDGLEDMLTEVPWDLVDVVFLGGSDGFKTGEAGRLVTKWAKNLGKEVHMGRVNSGKRLALAQSWGCDTADGTFLAFGPEKNLPRLLAWLDELAPQPPAGPAVTQLGPVCAVCTHFANGRRVQVRHATTDDIRTCSALRRATRKAA